MLSPKKELKNVIQKLMGTGKAYTVFPPLYSPRGLPRPVVIYLSSDS